MAKVSIRTDVEFSSLYPIALDVNRVSYRAAVAINTSLLFDFLLSLKAPYSPIIYKNSIKAKVDVNSYCICVISIVGKLYLHLAKMFPISEILSIGEIIGLTPPSLSYSAKFKHILNSYSESPPNAEAIKTPSGSSVY